MVCIMRVHDIGRLHAAFPLLVTVGLAACTDGKGECFIAGTLIDTPSGPRPIEMLRVGDVVWSFSFERKERIARRVAAVLQAEARETRRIAVGGRIIAGVTPSHPFYDAARGTYREVRDLKVGDLLAVAGEVNPRSIERIDSTELSARSIAVFNLTIDGPEANYFATGILVHNKSPPSLPSCRNGTVEIAEHRDVEPDASFFDRVDGGLTSMTGDFDVSWKAEPSNVRLEIGIRTDVSWHPRNTVVTPVTPTLYRVRMQEIVPGDYELDVDSTLPSADSLRGCRATVYQPFSIVPPSQPDASTTDATSDASVADVGSD